MKYSTLFFDLDDTLYPSTTGLWEAIRERMNRYMVEAMGLPAEDVPAIRRFYYETYGSTLRGLQKHYLVDADEYLAYVHDLPIEQFVPPDPALRALLLSLPQRRFIFTNADADHAARVMAALGVADCFAQVIDVRALKFYCKPEPAAYHAAMTLAGESDPARCVYLDDSRRNLAPAHQMGFTTLLVGADGGCPEARHSLARLHELPLAMPELWQNE
ncbi:MAG: pyrimidine 5'-nucleotidase [Chloroflexi bacterium]|nr:pyrimidine 5'-nucleotidase [Chloroflexota bacterium]